MGTHKKNYDKKIVHEVLKEFIPAIKKKAQKEVIDFIENDIDSEVIVVSKDNVEFIDIERNKLIKILKKRFLKV